MERSSHVWWQYDRRRRLIQVADVKRLALHTNVNRLQRVQAHLRRRWLLLCLLWLRSTTAHAHLGKLLCDALHALL